MSNQTTMTREEFTALYPKSVTQSNIERNVEKQQMCRRAIEDITTMRNAENQFNAGSYYDCE